MTLLYRSFFSSWNWKKKLNGCKLCRKTNKKPWILWSLSFCFVITVYYCVTNVQNVWDPPPYTYTHTHTNPCSLHTVDAFAAFGQVKVCRKMFPDSSQSLQTVWELSWWGFCMLMINCCSDIQQPKMSSANTEVSWYMTRLASRPCSATWYIQSELFWFFLFSKRKWWDEN